MTDHKFLVDVLCAVEWLFSDRLRYDLYPDRSWTGMSDPRALYCSVSTDDAGNPYIMAQATVKPDGVNAQVEWSLMVGKHSIDDVAIVEPRPRYGLLRKEVADLISLTGSVK